MSIPSATEPKAPVSVPTQGDLEPESDGENQEIEEMELVPVGSIEE